MNPTFTDPAHARNCSPRPIARGGSISLPVLPPTDHTIRASKSGKRRAIVLVCVQLLMIVHVALWLLGKKYGWFGGRTISPVEPSEAMQFPLNGAVNAGLIFFGLALLSTLVLGRWFCGWGCHVVMLQDFCGWIMKKCGVRPRPFRSRLLMYVPLLLGFYMFLMPAVYRFGLVPLDAKISAKLGEDHGVVKAERTIAFFTGYPLPPPGIAPWKPQNQLTTTEFWQTFPGIAVAIPFVLICGFGVVYFLGAKGFCTYGCPYGGFFAPLDKLAPARIIVTDACEHCGHCTAVCTSNVRVHEEVREYGMVVDPGCMKCLDCVSVCPNEALYFGFAKPAILKGPAKNAAPQRTFDLTWGEELVFAFVFLLTFVSWRGVYDLIPMLMAAGMAGIITYLAWKAWRLIRDTSVTVHRFQLKFKGSIRRSGWVFAMLVVSTLLLTVHCGVVNAAYSIGGYYDAKVTVPRELIFGTERAQIPPEMASAAEQAIQWYAFASNIRSGGIGLISSQQVEIDVRRAWLACAQLKFDQAEQLLRESLRLNGDNERLAGTLALAMRGQGKNEEAIAFYKDVLARHVEYESMAGDFVAWAQAEGDPDWVVPFLREQYLRYPASLLTMRLLSKVLIETGQFDEGVPIVQRTIAIDPNSAWAYYYLAVGLANQNQLEDAIKAMEKGLSLLPDDIQFNGMMSSLLGSVGRNDEAKTYYDKAVRLQQELMEHQQQPASQPTP